MKQGKVEKEILETCRVNRLPIPEKILNKPKLILGLEIFYSAFIDLSTCRDLGMTDGPISWTSAKQYADYLGLDADDFQYFWALISAMDSAYFSYRDEERKKTEKNVALPKRRN